MFHVSSFVLLLFLRSIGRAESEDVEAREGVEGNIGSVVSFHRHYPKPLAS